MPISEGSGFIEAQRSFDEYMIEDPEFSPS
jgi:hypothetical protein